MKVIKKENKLSTLWADSIDFFGSRQRDEAACTQNVDADELLGQVDYST